MLSPRLFDNLPLYARMLDRDGILEHICDAIQPELDRVAQKLRDRPYYFNPETAPAGMLPFLGQFAGLANEGDHYLGIGLNPDWKPSHMREVIKRAPQYWQRKGTEWAIREAIALWLMCDRAHDRTRLIIHLPFGKVPTEAPPNWWDYYTSYDFNVNKAWHERKFFGAGDYPQYDRGCYLNLQGETYGWHCTYLEQWSDQTLECDRAPVLITEGSGLGVQRPWMHFLAREDQWINIFPEILTLNPEIWSTHADPVVFGWLSYRLKTPLLLERSKQDDQYEIEEIWEPDGFQYNQCWYADFSGDITYSETIEELIDFGIDPGHGYDDPWNGEDQVTPEGYLYYVERGIRRLTRTETRTEYGRCAPGLEAEIITGYELKPVGGVDAIAPNQLLTKIASYRLATDLRLSIRYKPRFLRLTIGVTPRININNLGSPVAQAVDTKNLLIPDRIAPIQLAIAAPSIKLESGDEYRWTAPLGIQTYYSIWGDAKVYYSAGGLAIAPKLIETPVYQTVKLCNYTENYSTQKLDYYELKRTLLPIDKQDIFRLFPIVEAVSDAQNWVLLLETIETIYLLHPCTMFWTRQENGQLIDRAQSPDLETGRITLYLEFLVQPHVDDKLRSYTLNLQGKHLQTRTMPVWLDLPKQATIGLRFAIPLKFTSGADTLDEDFAISEYMPLIEDNITQLINQSISLLPDREPPLVPIPQPEPVEPVEPLRPTVESLRQLLKETNIQLDIIRERLGTAGDQVFFKPLNGGVVSAEAGVPKTTFRVTTGVGSDRFSVAQIREIEPPHVEVSRPEVKIVDLDTIELVFWSMVPDNSLEVWWVADNIRNPKT